MDLPVDLRLWKRLVYLIMRKSPYQDRRLRPAVLSTLLLAPVLFLSACQAEGLYGDPGIPTLVDPPAASIAPASRTANTEPPPTFTPMISSPTAPPSLGDASPTPSPTWTWRGPGEIVAPILLYHHVGEGDALGRYQVSEQAFMEQMAILRDQGYQTITVMTLLEAIRSGAALPSRPVIISFDDGNQSIFDTAYPIMDEQGYIGVAYIVANRVGAEGFIGVDDLKTLADAGWELGSHSMSHMDLVLSHEHVRLEILNSRLQLENELGLPIKTFAYPFGQMDAYVATQTRSYAYAGAVGLGTSCIHDQRSLYYLSRVEITREVTGEQFQRMLGRARDPDAVAECGSWSP